MCSWSKAKVMNELCSTWIKEHEKIVGNALHLSEWPDIRNKLLMLRCPHYSQYHASVYWMSQNETLWESNSTIWAWTKSLFFSRNLPTTSTCYCMGAIGPAIAQNIWGRYDHWIWVPPTMTNCKLDVWLSALATNCNPFYTHGSCPMAQQLSHRADT